MSNIIKANNIPAAYCACVIEKYVAAQSEDMAFFAYSSRKGDQQNANTRTRTRTTGKRASLRLSKKCDRRRKGIRAKGKSQGS
jgi:hypothetical protein